MATEKDKPNTGIVATLFIIGALVTLCVANFVTGMVRTEVREHGLQVEAFADLDTVRDLKEEQRASLAAPPKWINAAEGRVSIPIDNAMALVVKEVSKNPFLATPSPPEKEDEDKDKEGEDKGEEANKEGEEQATEDAKTDPGDKQPGDKQEGDKGEAPKKESPAKEGSSAKEESPKPPTTPAPKPAPSAESAPKAPPAKPEGEATGQAPKDTPTPVTPTSTTSN